MTLIDPRIVWPGWDDDDEPDPTQPDELMVVISPNTGVRYLTTLSGPVIAIREELVDPIAARFVTVERRVTDWPHDLLDPAPRPTTTLFRRHVLDRLAPLGVKILPLDAPVVPITHALMRSEDQIGYVAGCVRVEEDDAHGPVPAAMSVPSLVRS